MEFFFVGMSLGGGGGVTPQIMQRKNYYVSHVPSLSGYRPPPPNKNAGDLPLFFSKFVIFLLILYCITQMIAVTYIPGISALVVFTVSTNCLVICPCCELPWLKHITSADKVLRFIYFCCCHSNGVGNAGIFPFMHNEIKNRKGNVSKQPKPDTYQ